MSFQFGNLPYGYNPFSTNMTTLGGAFNDTPVWNLADPQVQSQMTLPLFANWGEVVRNNQLSNLSNLNNSGNFYNNMLRTQAMMSAGAPQSSGNDMMMQMFQMMMLMKKLNKPNTTKEGSSSTSSTVNISNHSGRYVDNSSHDGDGTSTPKVHRYDLTDGKNDTKDLAGFKTDKNDDSVLIYGDMDDFAKISLQTITGKKDATTISLDDALKGFGIDKSKLSKDDKKKLKDAIGNVDILSISGKTIENTSYYKFLKSLGLTESNTEIKKGDLKINTAITEQEPTPTSNGVVPMTLGEVKEKVNRLAALVDNNDSRAELSKDDIAEIKNIIASATAADKDTLKTFIEIVHIYKKIKGENGTETILGSIFTGLAESDDVENDKTAISIFESDILKPLKEAAKKNGLNAEWNKTIAALSAYDKTKMRNEVDGFWDWTSNDGSTTERMLRLAQL